MNMKVCKVKPDTNTCCGCVDNQIWDKENKSCQECKAKQPEHEILKIFTTFFGKVYALVIIDEKIKKLPIDRLYDVREVQPTIMMGGNGKYYGY